MGYAGRIAFMVRVVVVAFMLPGCSFMFMTRPPPREDWPAERRAGEGSLVAEHKQRGCTESRAAPILDVTLAGGLPALALIGLSANKGSDDVGVGVALAMSVVLAVPLAGSGLFGFASARHCRAYHEGRPYESDR